MVSLVAGPLLWLTAPVGRPRLAASLFAGSLSALFGVSALYHRITWSVRARRWVGRLDHAMIYLLIAGSVAPLGLLVLSGTPAVVMLSVVWGGAAAGIGLHTVWLDAPKWLSVLAYVALSWTGALAIPQLVAQLGWGAGTLFVLEGLFYSAGALAYILRRPDPVPGIFGYHEVFHALVIAGAATHYAVLAFFVLPSA